MVTVELDDPLDRRARLVRDDAWFDARRVAAPRLRRDALRREHAASFARDSGAGTAPTPAPPAPAPAAAIGVEWALGGIALRGGPRSPPSPPSAASPSSLPPPGKSASNSPSGTSTSPACASPGAVRIRSFGSISLKLILRGWLLDASQRTSLVASGRGRRFWRTHASSALRALDLGSPWRGGRGLCGHSGARPAAPWGSPTFGAALRARILRQGSRARQTGHFSRREARNGACIRGRYNARRDAHEILLPLSSVGDRRLRPGASGSRTGADTDAEPDPRRRPPRPRPPRPPHPHRLPPLVPSRQAPRSGRSRPCPRRASRSGTSTARTSSRTPPGTSGESPPRTIRSPAGPRTARRCRVGSCR